MNMKITIVKRMTMRLRILKTRPWLAIAHELSLDDRATVFTPTVMEPLKEEAGILLDRVWQIGISNLETGRRSSVTNDPRIRQDMALFGSTFLLANYLQQKNDGATNRNRSVDFIRASSRRLTDSLRVNLEEPTPSNIFSKMLQLLQQLEPGSLKQSVIIAIFVTFVNGICCLLYYEMLDFSLDLVWRVVPEKRLQLDPDTSWWWIPAVNFAFSLFLGLTVILLGEPGDMPFTVACVHRTGYIQIDHVLPMVFTSYSYFSILMGGSLGPEALFLALTGWISKSFFCQTQRNVVRKHTLMGMSGALAAFFGAPMGGSFFALEINSRFGIEYYKHLMESLLCGELTMLVFRSRIFPSGPSGI